MNRLTKYIVGIDLGIQGGVSCLKYELDNSLDRKKAHSIELVEAFTMPKSYRQLYEIIDKWNQFYKLEEVIIEKALIVKGNSRATLQSISKNYGACSATCEIAKVQYREVNPNDWQSIIKDVEINSHFKEISNKKKEIKDTKLRSLSKAFKLFPKAPLTSKRGRILDGIADSIMIAYWGIFNSREEHETLLQDRAKLRQKRKQKRKRREAKKNQETLNK